MHNLERDYKLTDQEIDLIVYALGKGKLEKNLNVFMKIKSQFDEQNKPKEE